MSKWKVQAFDAGTTEIDKSLATYLTDCGQKLRIPNIIYLIEGEKKIIVDTSFESVERTKRINNQPAWRSEEQEVTNILKRINVAPEEIDIVIFTHLHYDHCGNNPLFSRARFIVQRKELRYAFVPLPGEETAYFSPLIGEKPSFWGTPFELIKGDKEICTGVKVITVPGHTPGSQAVLVDTENGIYCIAGDLVFLYENMERNIPIGFFSSRLDWFSSIEKIKGMADYIIPSHDPKIFEKSKYPEFPGK